MSKARKFFTGRVEAISEKTGKIVCYLILVIMAITTWEVVSRYVFNQPTLWVWPINRQLFGVFILIAGAYTMSKEGHIRVEILYDFFPPAMKTFARWTTLVCLVLFLGVLIWQGALMGWNSWKVGEVASGAFRIPLYPLKLLIPLAIFLFLLEGINLVILRDKQ